MEIRSRKVKLRRGKDEEGRCVKDKKTENKDNEGGERRKETK
jgi:hypothetical protein